MLDRQFLIKREDQRDKDMGAREDARARREFKQRVLFCILSFGAGAVVAIVAATISSGEVNIQPAQPVIIEVTPAPAPVSPR